MFIACISKNARVKYWSQKMFHTTTITHFPIFTPIIIFTPEKTQPTCRSLMYETTYFSLLNRFPRYRPLFKIILTKCKICIQANKSEGFPLKKNKRICTFGFCVKVFSLNFEVTKTDSCGKGLRKKTERRNSYDMQVIPRTSPDNETFLR